MGGIWTLCDLWKMGVRRWIPIILIWRVIGGMKEKDLV
jgi:hypothetical protein